MSSYDDFTSWVKLNKSEELSSSAYYGKPIKIDYTELYDELQDFAFQLFQEPESILTESQRYLRNEARQLNPDMFVTEDDTVDIQIINLPDETDIKYLNHKNLGKLIQIEGIITQLGNPYPRMVDICYKCPVCLDTFYIHQDEQFTKQPEKCFACDNRKGFIIVPDKTRYTTKQNGVIQELPEKTSGGSIPKNFKIEFTENLCDKVGVGGKVKLVGWIKGRLYKKNDPNPVLELYFYVNSITRSDELDIISEITEEEITEYHTWVQTEDFIEQLIASTAPTLKGLDEVKLFLCLQQVGGVSKKIGEEYKRGSIHGELAGDPGEGKSVCLEWAKRMSNRGIMVTGGGASGVGLTASADRDQLTGEWVLRAGALVLADKGHVSIDEIEKMRDEDREHIHPAMEAQRISVNKAGINAELYTRCSILGASNPKDGVWNTNIDIRGNVSNLPDTILTRFDCIFILTNDRKVEEELERADYVLDIHQKQITDQKISEEKLKKFFSYARTLKPRITDEVKERLRELYGVIFKASQLPDEKTIMITLRQLEGLIRLSEASAKLHLRDETIIDDAEVAIRVLKASMLQSAVNSETGELDMGRFYSAPKTKRDMIREAPKILEFLCRQNIDETQVSKQRFVEYSSKRWNISSGDVGEIMNLLLKDGTFFCPTPYTLALSDNQPQGLYSYSDNEENEDGKQDT